MNISREFRFIGVRLMKLVFMTATCVYAAGCAVTEVSDSMSEDQPSTMSPTEALRRASDTAARINSGKIRTVITRQERGKQAEMVLEDVFDERGRYSSTVQNNEIPWELLYYDKRNYTRASPAEPWREFRSPDTHTIASYAADDAMERVYWFNFDGLSDVKYADESDAAADLHLLASFETSFAPTSRTMREELQEGALLHGGGLPDDLGEPRAGYADTARGTVELRLDAEGFYIKALRVSVKLLKNGQEVGAYERTSEYSQFNEEIELPGPLPDG